MRSAFRRIALGALIFAVTLGLIGSIANAPVGGVSAALAQPAKFGHGHVYMLRGLANIWSRGIDKLGKELEADGFPVSVHNHRHWEKLAEQAAKKYSEDKTFAPVMIVGHSLGANAAVLMAKRMGESGVPVRLLITLDGVSNVTDAKLRISRNVEEVLNYYNSKLLGIKMVPGRGFKGEIENVDVSGIKGSGHLKIDKNPELQARITEMISEILD